MLIRVGDLFLLPPPWHASLGGKSAEPEPIVLLAIDPRGASLTFASKGEGTFVVPFHAVYDWKRIDFGDSEAGGATGS